MVARRLANAGRQGGSENMKKLALLIPLLFAGCSKNAGVTFVWNYQAFMPAGFEIRIMDSTNKVIQTCDCGAAPLKECTVTGIAAGPKKAQCFAYGSRANAIQPVVYSEGSNIVSFAVPTGSAKFGIKNGDPFLVQLTFNRDK